MKHDSVSSQVQTVYNTQVKTVEPKPEKKHSEKFMGMRPLWFMSSDDDAGVRYII